MTQPLQLVLDRLQQCGCDPRPRGSGWQARVPGRDDRNPSLSINVGDDGRVLLKDWGGKRSFEEICEALDLESRQLFPPEGAVQAHSNNGHKRKAYPTLDDAVEAVRRSVRGRLAGRWTYQDRDGNESFHVVRFDLEEPGPDGKVAKCFRPFHQAPDGWVIADPPGKLPLYGLANAMATDRVFVCEGEKAADAGRSIGIVTTSPAHGAQSPHKSDWAPLVGKDVVILPDRDEAGESFARRVLDQLRQLDQVPSVRILRLGGLEDHGDLYDWVDAWREQGLDDSDVAEEIHRLADEAVVEQLVTPPAEHEAVLTAEFGVRDDRLDDIANGRRLIARFGASMRWSGAQKCWLVWDGRRWAVDVTGQADRNAKDTARAIYHEAAESGSLARSKEVASHAERSASAVRIAAMLQMARSEPGIAVRTEELDVDPMLFNVLNGTLDLRTGQLLPHDSDRLITKLAPVEYHAEAQCPLWLAFLDRIMGGSSELIEFLQCAAGYCLTGEIGERSMFIPHGPGANGKSVFLETLRSLMGSYATAVQPTTLMSSKQDGPRNDLAALKGCRLVTTSETNEGRRLDEAMVKQITGGDTIAARFLFGEFFTFRPECKFWLATNHRPEIRGTDEGIWSRIRLIPFSVTIPKAERDQQLRTRLEQELPGILTWALRGCLKWQRDGLGTPEAVSVATSEYRTEMDVLGEFLEECCECHADFIEGATALYKAYKAWCTDHGEQLMSQTRFGRRLSDRGYKAAKCGILSRIGLRLRHATP